jgi:hypothetical protein
MEKNGLCDLRNRVDFKLIETFRHKLISYLCMYFYRGVMPEVVSKFEKVKILIWQELYKPIC